MRAAILLDRDGVLNQEQGYVWRWEDFRWQPGILECLQTAVAKGYLLAVITNQGGIAKGLYSRADVEALHTRMRAELRAVGVVLQAVYYCPHHPEVELCLCRKPHSLLFQRALARMGADPARSYMVGDQARDLLPAQRLGLRTLYLGSDASVPADFRFANADELHTFLQADVPSLIV